MHWSVSLLLMTSLGALEADHNLYDSYTKAYWAASEAKQPMLVVLNPGTQAVSTTGESISVSTLEAQDPELRKVLQDYVVAEIDTTTEHGQQVYKLFGSPSLPRVVVIDDHQAKQVFRTSDHLQASTLRNVLVQYKDGAVTTPAATSMQSFIQGSCPNCQRRAVTSTF